MLFNKKTEYSIRIMLFMLKRKGQIISAGSVADKLNLPGEFVSKILQSLSRDGFLRSRKGKGGGFMLSENSAESKLVEIINTYESNSISADCIMGVYEFCIGQTCPLYEDWNKLLSNLENRKIETLKNFLD